MKELSIFDLRFGFYVKNYPYGQSPKSEIAHPGQNMRTIVFYIRFPILTQKFVFFSEGPGGFRGLLEAGRNDFHHP